MKNFKKVLGSVFTIGIVFAIMIMAVNAYFSDTETSTGNIFQAGAVDLRIDSVAHYNGMVCAEHTDGGYMWVPFSEDLYDDDWHAVSSMTQQEIDDFNNANQTQYPQAGVTCEGSWRLANLDDNTVSGTFFNYTDVKPGDEGENTISLHVINNDAWMCAALGNVGPDSPEANDLAFQEGMSFFAWMDDGNNIYDDGETALTPNPVTGDQIQEAVFAIADSTTGDGPIPGEETQYIGLAWCAGTMTVDGNDIQCDGAGMDNDAQMGSMTADIQFYAIQARNNAGFTCAADYTPTWPEQEGQIEVGANLSLYNAPAVCDETADSQTSIQDAITAADDNDTVCVVNGTYNETVVIDKPLTLASLSGPLTSATIQNGVHIKSSNVTLTGFIINPGVILGENIAVYLDGGISDVTVSFNDLNGNSESPSRGVLTVTSGAYSNVMIVDNFIHNFVTGVYTNPGTNSIVVRYNDIYDNTAGIGGYTGAHVIYNEFSSAGEAMGVDGSYDNSVVEYNNFLSGAMLNNYDGGVTVSAPNNFWNISGAAQTSGNVNYTPEAGAQYTHR